MAFTSALLLAQLSMTAWSAAATALAPPPPALAFDDEEFGDTGAPDYRETSSEGAGYYDEFGNPISGRPTKPEPSPPPPPETASEAANHQGGPVASDTTPTPSAEAVTAGLADAAGNQDVKSNGPAPSSGSNTRLDTAPESSQTGSIRKARPGGRTLRSANIEIAMSAGILIFGLVALSLVVHLSKKDKVKNTGELLLVVTIIVLGVLLVPVGYSEEQTAPVYGLYGAIVGYLLGSGKVGGNSNSGASGTPSDDGNGGGSGSPR